MNPFDVKTTERDGSATVAVSGDLDCATAPRLRATLERVASARRTVLVDLSGTEFMDCAGVGVLVGSHTRLCDLGGDLIVGSTSDAVLRVLELTGAIEEITTADGSG